MTAPLDTAGLVAELRALASNATTGKWYIYTGEDGEPISLAADGVGPNGGWVGKTVAQFGVPYRTRTAEQIAAERIMQCMKDAVSVLENGKARLAGATNNPVPLTLSDAGSDAEGRG